VKLDFTKEIIEKYDLLNYGTVKDCGQYKLFHNDNLLGQFFYSEYASYFTFENFDIKIETTKHFLKRWEYKIIDQTKSLEIGNYETTSWINRKRNIGRIRFDNEIYKCERLKPEIENKYFKRETWGHYKIRLCSQQDTIIYKFKLDIPWIGGLDSAFTPFVGQIETTCDNLFPVFAGLFLIEQIFENEKSSI